MMNLKKNSLWKKLQCKQHPNLHISEWKLYLSRIIDNKLKNINIIACRSAKIDYWAFSDCESLKTIYVPAKKADYYKQRLPEELHQFIVEMEPVKKAKKK